MLHVTNGRMAMIAIGAAAIEGPILPWDDVLHDGPVPRTSSDAELRRVRARFLAARGWETEDGARRGLAERDAQLERAAEHDEVVLWFESDLYDQLQLIDVLRRPALREHARVTAADVGDYIGPAPPERVRHAYDQRAPVVRAAFEQAVRAWDVFTAPDPLELAALVEQGAPALPHLGSALLRLLEEYPGSGDGLGRTERQTLEALAGGPMRIRDAYVRAHHEREDPIFLGDASFAALVAELSAAPDPIVVREDGARVPPPDDLATFLDVRIRLGDLGERILAGTADRVRDAGVDRWFGGVHLSGRTVPWRWDRERAALVRTGAP